MKLKSTQSIFPLAILLILTSACGQKGFHSTTDIADQSTLSLEQELMTPEEQQRILGSREDAADTGTSTGSSGGGNVIAATPVQCGSGATTQIAYESVWSQFPNYGNWRDRFIPEGRTESISFTPTQLTPHMMTFVYESNDGIANGESGEATVHVSTCAGPADKNLRHVCAFRASGGSVDLRVANNVVDGYCNLQPGQRYFFNITCDRAYFAGQCHFHMVSYGL